MSSAPTPMRLNKFLAHAGYGSRRQVEELIVGGRVSINGETVTELGTRVEPDQKIRVDGTPVKQEKPIYWLVNKPRGVLCTNYDPDGRTRVIDLVPHISQRVYTVGRLDEASEGLILLTNDGDLANRLMHPKFGVEKTYLVQVAGFPTLQELRQLTEGVWISDGRVRAKKVKRLKTQKQSTWLRIVLNEGKNREIRRMLAKLNHKVITLKRIAIGPIKIGALATGRGRKLRGDEVELLREAAMPESGVKNQESAVKNQGSGGRRQGSGVKRQGARGKGRQSGNKGRKPEGRQRGRRTKQR